MTSVSLSLATYWTYFSRRPSSGLRFPSPAFLPGSAPSQYFAAPRLPCMVASRAADVPPPSSSSAIALSVLLPCGWATMY